jgi:ribosome-binding protein aMBF1 (putative translation factor)
MRVEELSSLVSWHRKRAGLSQEDLAAHANVSRYVVQDIEAGHGRTTWKKLDAVLTVLNLRLEPEGPLVAAWRKEALRQDEG